MPIGVPAIIHMPDPDANVTGKYILVVNTGANVTELGNSTVNARKYLSPSIFRAPLIFTHLIYAKIKGSNLAHENAQKCKGNTE